MGSNVSVIANERSVRTYDVADEKGLRGIPMKAVEVNSDIYINDITILE